jgi:hypothetical protein
MDIKKSGRMTLDKIKTTLINHNHNVYGGSKID